MSFGVGFRLYLNFPGKVALILGVCLAILGILDIILAVTGFVTKIWGHYYATGIWCGVVVFIDGLCGILASQTRTNFAVKTFFFVSLISVLVTFVMIILSCGGLDFNSKFYNQVFSYTGKDGHSTKAVHGSLLALAIVEFVVSIINAILCLKSSCQEDKSAWSYDQPKGKQSSVAHRPPSSNDGKSPGFRGGNPQSIPSSELPVKGRYYSPRRSQNGYPKESQREASVEEPTEATTFLPDAAFAHYIEEELSGREQKRQRRLSHEKTDQQRKNSGNRPTKGRMYRRQQATQSNNFETVPLKTQLTQERDVPNYQERPIERSNTNVVSEMNPPIPAPERMVLPENQRRESTIQKNDKRPTETPSISERERKTSENRPNSTSTNEVLINDLPNSPNSTERIKYKPVERRGLYRERRRSAEQEGRVSVPMTKKVPLSRSLERPSSKRTHVDSANRTIPFMDSVPIEEETNPISHIELSKPAHVLEVKKTVHTESRVIKKSVPAPEVTPFIDQMKPASEYRTEEESHRQALKQQPLRRSIGLRGSYNAAVNLMPSELEEKGDQKQYEPPTAFGEEELPAYAEVLPPEPHLYSSIESAISRPETDRVRSSDQEAYSADHSIVSQSVADEEVQRILGTRTATPIRREPFPQIPENTLKSTNIPHNNIRFETPSLEQNSQIIRKPLTKLSLKTKEISHEQSSSEASLALPSPLSSSPPFVRSQKTRTSDIFPISDGSSIPDISSQNSFRASFPLRKSGKDRHPRSWGITQMSEPDSRVVEEGEGHALNELTSSFPLLGTLGGVDFGMSDQESYLQTPDSSIYSFKFEEVKPRVFTVSPFRTPRRSSPLSGISVPQMPSTDDELETRLRVIETVNVGAASPPRPRRSESRNIKSNNLNQKPALVKSEYVQPPHYPSYQAMPSADNFVSDRQTYNRPSPSGKERPLERRAEPSYFYPPNMLPSRVSDTPSRDGQVRTKYQTNFSQETQPSMFSRNVPLRVTTPTAKPKTSSALSPSQSITRSDRSNHGPSSRAEPINPNARETPLMLGSSRPEDASVAFHAFHNTLSNRSSWERQTFPPVQFEQSAIESSRPKQKTRGRAAMRNVMRSEQAAQEEPLHQQLNIDPRFRIARTSAESVEPSPPSTGGPPPYSSVARNIVAERNPQRASHQPHTSARQNRSEPQGRQHVFSLVL